MTTLTELKDAIKAKMMTVAGVENVYTYEPFAEQQSAQRAFYKDTSNDIHGYFITRVATKGVPAFEKTDIVDFAIRGLRSLNESQESELAFDLEIEAIRSAFDDDHTLGDLVDDISNVEGLSGLQVIDEAKVMFCGILCHAVDMSLKVSYTPDLTPATAPDDFLQAHTDIDMAPSDTVIDADDVIDLPQ